MAKISIYINSRSSGEGKHDWRNSLDEAFFRHELYFHHPLNLKELLTFIERDKERQVDYIFSIGGDGTINKIIQHLVGEEISLMVIPTGTANDLAHELSVKASIKKVHQIFQKKSISKIDAIKVNSQYMLTCGGLGLGANVAKKVNELRGEFPLFKKVMGLTGAPIYAALLGLEFFKSFKQEKMFVKSKNFPRLKNIQKVSMLMINNQPIVGGRFNVAPSTKNNDGTFNVTIFTHENKLCLIRAIVKTMQGIEDANDENLIRFETNRLEVMCLDRSLPFFGDGEILDNTQNYIIECAPRSLNVFHLPEMEWEDSFSLNEVQL